MAKRIVEVDTLHGVQTILLQKAATTDKCKQYKGPNGHYLFEDHNEYLNRCSEFRARAKQYHDNNVALLNSLKHQYMPGYETDEQFNWDKLAEREEATEKYLEALSSALKFDSDPTVMYRAESAKFKRIRMVRELGAPSTVRFSKTVEFGKGRWFTRYCTLARFVQAARKIILFHRLRKNLAKLRKLTPKEVASIEAQIELEEKDSYYVEPEIVEKVEEVKEEVYCAPCLSRIVAKCDTDLN